MLRPIVLFLLILMYPLIVVGQASSQSLNCSTLFAEKNYDQSLVCYKKSLQFYQVDSIGAMLKIGVIYLLSQRYDSANMYFYHLIEISGRRIDLRRKAVGFNNLGISLNYQGNYAESIFAYEQALALYQELNNDTLEAQSLYNLGIVYKNQGIFDRSLQFLFKAISSFEEINDIVSLGKAYAVIGNILKEQGEYQEARKFHRKSLLIRKERNDWPGVSRSFNDLGNIFKLEGFLDSAYRYYSKSLTIKDTLGDRALQATTLDNLGELFLLRNEFLLAEKYLLESLNIKEELGDQRGISISLTELGRLAFEQEDYRKSAILLNRGRQVANSILARDILKENLDLSIQLRLKIGWDEEAKSLYSKYKALTDSLFNQQKTKALMELRIQYEVDKKEQENEILLEQREVQKLELIGQKRWNIFFLIIIVFLILIGISLFLFFKEKKRNVELQSLRLQEQHHRTKNFLQMLISLFRQQAELFHDPVSKSIAKDGENRVNAMLLVNSTFHNSLDPERNILDLSSFVRALTQQLNLVYHSAVRPVNIEFFLDSVKISYEKAILIALILNELVNNAFKYAFRNGKNPKLEIYLSKSNSSLHLCIKDNGKGLPENLKIDELRSSGLKLVKQLVDVLRGEIQYIQNNGTETRINIPLTKKSPLV